MPNSSNARREEVHKVIKTDMREDAKMVTMSMIWYLIATFGLLPPRICPVIVPGKAISPITAMDAIVGLNDFIRASFIKGDKASFLLAPFPSR